MIDYREFKYEKNCSSCHGKKRNGVSNKKKEKLIKRTPGLVGFYAMPNKIGSFDSLEKINNRGSFWTSDYKFNSNELLF